LQRTEQPGVRGQDGSRLERRPSAPPRTDTRAPPFLKPASSAVHRDLHAGPARTSSPSEPGCAQRPGELRPIGQPKGQIRAHQRPNVGGAWGAPTRSPCKTADSTTRPRSPRKRADDAEKPRV